MPRALPMIVGISLLLIGNGMAQQSGNASSPAPGNQSGEEGQRNQQHPPRHGWVRRGRKFFRGDSMPLRGISVSTFDTKAHKWKQTWVDNQGGYLDLVGEFKDGQMILARDARGKDGSKVLQRMVFKNITAKELDWSWERSSDGGKTWQVVWPNHYRRKS